SEAGRRGSEAGRRGLEAGRTGSEARRRGWVGRAERLGGRADRLGGRTPRLVRPAFRKPGERKGSGSIDRGQILRVVFPLAEGYCTTSAFAVVHPMPDLAFLYHAGVLVLLLIALLTVLANLALFG